MAAERQKLHKFSSVFLVTLCILEQAGVSLSKQTTNIDDLKRRHDAAHIQHRNNIPSPQSNPNSIPHPAHQLPTPHPGHHHPQQQQQVVTSQYQTLSVVMETHNKFQQRFIQVQSPPSVYPPENILQIEYECLPGEVAGVEVDVRTTYGRHFRPVTHYWTCAEHSKHARKVFQRLLLPDSMVYQPDYLNRHVRHIDTIEISVWILQGDVFHSRRGRFYESSAAKAKYQVTVLPMYSRPRKNHRQSSCLTWEAELMLQFSDDWNGILQCSNSHEVIELLTFPVAFPSRNFGVSRDIPPPSEPGLKLLTEAHLNHPKFTISAVVYIIEYCEVSLCGLVHRKTQYSNRYVSPLIFLNNRGEVFIQVETESRTYMSMINRFKLPLNEWLYMVYVQDGQKWSLEFSTDDKSRKWMSNGKSAFSAPVRYNESDAFYHLGGSSAVPSFAGYMLNAKLWRWQALHPDKVPREAIKKLSYTSGISQYYQQCSRLHQSMERVFSNFKLKLQDKLKKKTCANVNPLLPTTTEQPDLPFCNVWQQPVPRRQYKLWVLLQQSAAISKSYHTAGQEYVGYHLYQHALTILQDHGLQQVRTILPWLKQSGCCGNYDATGLLATLYAGGLGVEISDSKAILYWLVAAQQGSRVAMLALGNKHYNGADQLVPADTDYAYRYYSHVAQETILDRSKHAADGIYFEAIRLTDEEQLKTQTGETGDYFKWLKHQAKQGVSDAQVNLARMYYHGSSGVQRDMAAAAEIYRMNALQNPDDPVAQYDYSVILLRGQGTEKDMEKGLEYLNRSAELGHGPAFSALGWFELNVKQNDTAAAQYFEKGDSMGHRDAAHNLGFMYLVGRYPGHPQDRMKAFEYYMKAARADHWDSASKVADLYNEGNEQMARNNSLAAAWARYVAEMNRDIAWSLRRGLDAHLKGSWSESLVHYAIAAEAGLEIGQFNLAYLCEENFGDVAMRYVDRDCAWKYWTLAASVETPHITSILKVADFLWYGYNYSKDEKRALQYYIQAARTHKPQALFNLAYLVETGVTLKPEVWGSLGVTGEALTSQGNLTMVMELYRMCRDSNAEGYLPCSLALLNLQLRQVWEQNSFLIQMTSGVVVGLLTVLAVASIVASASSNNNSSNSNNSGNNGNHIGSNSRCESNSNSNNNSNIESSSSNTDNGHINNSSNSGTTESAATGVVTTDNIGQQQAVATSGNTDQHQAAKSDNSSAINQFKTSNGDSIKSETST